MFATSSRSRVPRVAASLLIMACFGTATARCMADVTESGTGDGAYVVISPTTRSRADVMKSFAEWRTSNLTDAPNPSVASWSADNGLLTERESSGDRLNRIKFNDLDMKSLRASRGETWQIRATTISGHGNGFSGQLRAADDAANVVARQALQDIYDLAYLTQQIAAAKPSLDNGAAHPLAAAIADSRRAVLVAAAATVSPAAAIVPASAATVPPAAVTVSPAAASVAPALGAASGESQPPFGKKVAAILPLPTTPSLDEACPYPSAARARGETGVVLLLVHVAPDGSALDTAIDQSSGSESLDQATAACVKASGRFAIRRSGSKAISYWGRMKFNWGFGG
jgi:TonB family protein